MTTMERIGLGVGIFIAAARLPAVFWPEAYVRGVRSLVLDRPLVVRAIGGLLLALAATVVVLVAQTLTTFQAVMLVLAVLFVAGGIAMLLFTDGYRAFSERLLAGMPLVGVRLGGVLGVAVGAGLVFLSLSVR
jgi:hypothetical protein